jgi:hypothetical protein
MGPVVIVIVLPFAKFVVEQVDIIPDAVLVEELVKLLLVDAVRALDLAIQPGRSELRLWAGRWLAAEASTARQPPGSVRSCSWALSWFEKGARMSP